MRKLLLSLALLSMMVIGCNQTKSEANIPERLEIVSNQQIGDHVVYVLKDKVTGEEFVYAEQYKSVAITQIVKQK